MSDNYQEVMNCIPLHEPKFTGNKKAYLIDCIDSTFVSSVGKYVARFEHQVAEITSDIVKQGSFMGSNAVTKKSVDTKENDLISAGSLFKGYVNE